MKIAIALILLALTVAGVEAGPGPRPDPYYRTYGSWGQAYDDQWYLKQVGFGPDAPAWELVGKRAAPVVVAVIDTGLDWNHLDLDWQNLWRNPGEIPGNGVDDDGNGYADDIIGWDFVTHTNKPWDYDGHGTLTAGIIAAKRGNGIGISGINPHVRLMILKAMNNFGHGRASFLAEAVAYAVDNGARVINISIAGQGTTKIEDAALDYAVKRGVLVVVAAGNEGKVLTGYGPASQPGVLTVAAVTPDLERAPFSNWGEAVDLAAPGVDILSLRARRTDTQRDIPGLDYTPGAAYVGHDRRYYRATGTSFAAPIVTGIASLMLSARPELTGDQLQRILKNSAADIDVAGIDQYSGYGLVDAVAALQADPEFFVEARITGVAAVRTPAGPPAVSVRGVADADAFRRVSLSVGRGDNPKTWQRAGTPKTSPVRGGEVGQIPAKLLAGSKTWTIRAVVEHRNGRSREARFKLTLN